MNMPDRAVIEKLLLGQLSPEIAEALCRQLEDEAAFAAVAGMVMKDDTFVGGLRSASTTETRSLSPGIEDLIRRFRSWESEMLHGGTVAAPGPGSAPGFAATPRVAKSSDTIDLDLGGSDPTHIGGFRVLRKLGQGGMGAVYLGEDV